MNQQRLLVYDGALPGGFSKEALSQWANHTWVGNKQRGGNRRRGNYDKVRVEEDNKEHYVDLFSERISLECTENLKHQKHPSSDLTTCYFDSYRFLPERCLLTPLFFFLNSSSTVEHSSSSTSIQMPKTFSMHTKFLAWTVQVDTPLETICTWEFNGIKGCTMIGFDPQLKRVYHGNCLQYSSMMEHWTFQTLMIPLHQWYARFLLRGMVYGIEKWSEKLSLEKKKVA